MADDGTIKATTISAGTITAKLIHASQPIKSVRLSVDAITASQIDIGTITGRRDDESDHLPGDDSR